MPLRETRRFKTKGFVISFGDIMLPLVGFIAIGLLLVAGKLFFLSGTQPDSPPIPVIGEPPHPPQRQEQERNVPSGEKSAEASSDSAKVQPSEEIASETPSERKSLPAVDVWAVPYDSKIENSPAVPAQTPTTSTPRTTTTVVSRSSGASGNPPPSTRTQPQPAVRVVTPEKKNTPQTSAQSSKTASAASSGWMVQIGAFSTKAAADAVMQQVSKAGHSATVISGKTLHRVLVQAGATRNEALTMATRMSQSGFPGAFIVPPRQ